MRRERTAAIHLIILSEIVIISLLLVAPKQNIAVQVVENTLPPIVIQQPLQVEPEVVPEVVITERKREQVLVSRSLPQGVTGRFKTFMDYRAITNKDSDQWKMQQDAETDEHGFRKYNNKYMVAVGSYYADKCGKALKITLDSGIVIDVVVGDLKQDIHTDPTNRFVSRNGNIVEFIVDTKKLSKLSRKMGDVSYSGLEGNIQIIEEVK